MGKNTKNTIRIYRILNNECWDLDNPALDYKPSFRYEKAVNREIRSYTSFRHLPNWITMLSTGLIKTMPYYIGDDEVILLEELELTSSLKVLTGQGTSPEEIYKNSREELIKNAVDTDDGVSEIFGLLGAGVKVDGVEIMLTRQQEALAITRSYFKIPAKLAKGLGHIIDIINEIQDSGYEIVPRRLEIKLSRTWARLRKHWGWLLNPQSEFKINNSDVNKSLFEILNKRRSLAWDTTGDKILGKVTERPVVGSLTLPSRTNLDLIIKIRRLLEEEKIKPKDLELARKILEALRGEYVKFSKEENKKVVEFLDEYRLVDLIDICHHTYDYGKIGELLVLCGAMGKIEV